MNWLSWLVLLLVIGRGVLYTFIQPQSLFQRNASRLNPDGRYGNNKNLTTVDHLSQMYLQMTGQGLLKTRPSSISSASLQ